ncbi:MAG: hypothetical protein ACXU9G_03370, partial [Syntrophales bacterium]
MLRESRFLLPLIFICLLLWEIFPVVNAYGQMTAGDEPSLIVGPEKSKDKNTKEVSPSPRHEFPSNAAVNEREG